MTFQSHRDNQRVTVEMWIVDLLDGDHVAAILFSQLLWWFQNSKGTTRLRVSFQRDGELWLVRGDDEWGDDCRLSVKQVRRVRNALIAADLIVYRRFKWKGTPTSAWRPNFAAIPDSDSSIRANGSTRDGEDGSTRDGQVPIDTDLIHRPEEPSPLLASSEGDAFEDFWRSYPKARRLAKPDARAAFKLAVKKVPAAQIVEAVKRYDADPNRLDGFTPYPQKWLKQERWNAPPEVKRSIGSRAAQREGENVSEIGAFLAKQQQKELGA